MDWPEAVRISGLEVATLQLRFSASAPARDAPKPPAVQVDEFKLWKVLQAERETAAGLAMWLAWQLGLQAQEMIALTWEQVDLEKGFLHLPDREILLASAVRRLTDQKRLIRVGGKYYLPGTVVPPQRQEAAVLEYLEREGFAYRQDVFDEKHNPGEFSSPGFAHRFPPLGEPTLKGGVDLWNLWII